MNVYAKSIIEKTKKFLVGYEIMTPEDIRLLLKNEINE